MVVVVVHLIVFSDDKLMISYRSSIRPSVCLCVVCDVGASYVHA